MVGCLHLPPDGGEAGRLAELAGRFSPLVEQNDARTVLCDLNGLDRLLGSPADVAAAIVKLAAGWGMRPNVAIAATPDAALLAARHLVGVNIIEPGHEPAVLCRLPVDVLPASDEFFDALARWGIRTLGQLAELPPLGLVERLGEEAARMRLLAMGEFERPLRIVVPREEYEARQELEEPARLLEPLLFIISAQLNDLVKRLAVQALAARRLTLTLELTDATTHLRRLDFPLPVRQARTLLKQVQLDLEAHPPEAAVRAVGVRLDAAAPRTVQNGLFRPAAPEPDKLHVTLARLAALVGDGAVGTPERLDTHRPDAYLLRPHALLTPPPERTVTRRAPLRLACRLYRPPLAATVRIMRERPVAIRSAMLTGTIQNAAGPWRTSGEWWAETRWARDEWDVALDDGALYRIFRDLDSARWFVDAMYD